MTSPPAGPPERARKILRRLTDYQDNFGIEEDMDAAFEEAARAHGRGWARRWYRRECLSAIVNYCFYLTTWGGIMLKNYTKTAARNLRRQKVFSIVNILGLSLGLASCILILLFVADELSFDRFHEKAERIYAVVCRNEFHNGTIAAASMGTGPALEQEFPEVERAIRMSGRNEATVQCKDRIFNENPLFVDPGFFEVFSFPLTGGSPETALQAKGSIVLTESAARKYFGRGRALGETLLLAFGDKQKEFIVSAVCQDPPPNSSIRFGMLININNLGDIQGPDSMNDFRFINTRVFVLLRKNAQPDVVNASFPAFVRNHFRETLQRYRDSGSWKKDGDVLTFRLENLRELHLNAQILGVGSRSIQHSLILAGIGILILIVACINFVNLSIGRASTRTLEVGMRKVLGARRRQLIHQFWMEAFLLSMLAMAAGLLVAFLALPTFNIMAEKSLDLKAFFTGSNLAIFGALLVIIAVASGSFPGLFLSRLDPADVLKAKMRWAGKHLFSRTLVVVQFALAAFLLVLTFTMADQFRFMSRVPLGFNAEGIVVVDLQEDGFDRGPQTEALIERFRTRLAGTRAIQNVSGAIMNFNRGSVANHIDVRGTVDDIIFNRVAAGYLETMGIPLLEGRDFTDGSAANASSVIINQAFVKRFALDNPIGLTIFDAYERDKPLTIIGVVEDYHYQSLKYGIDPVILHMSPNMTIGDMLVRISADDIPRAIKAIEGAWKALRPEKPFLYSFMDRDVDDSYVQQKRWMRIVQYSTILAVLISCMGIFAMTVISIARRVREITIRRVLGAGLGNIVGLIEREFIPLVIAANIIAAPIAYFAATRWLEGYAFRTNVTPSVFLFALLLSMAVALATVGVLALRAALADPMRGLRAE
jgi:putative ABC transport system permease protein